ncbi:MAG: LPS translocon maturation chaperone LptM [Methylosarcina sp.]
MKRYHVTLFSSIALLASACGQPGPLYLPAEEPAAQVPPASNTQSPSDLQAPPEQAEPKSETHTEPAP